MKTEERRELLDFAVRVAEYAGRATLAHFHTTLDVERKDDGTPVTVADREAERRVREAIAARFPADAIVGEEFGEGAGGGQGSGSGQASGGGAAGGEAAGGGGPAAGRRWIVDPIDGTKSFIHGVPLYGVLLALEEEGEPVVGVLHFPALGEVVAAAAGAGCWWNGRRVRVSEVDRLDRALVLATGDTPPGTEARVAAWRRLEAAAGVARTWGDAYGYALVATGRAEVMVDPIVRIWDVAAVRPVIEEAGGVFTDWDGRPDHTAGHAVATNAALAGVVREILGGGA